MIMIRNVTGLKNMFVCQMSPKLPMFLTKERWIPNKFLKIYRAERNLYSGPEFLAHLKKVLS